MPRTVRIAVLGSGLAGLTVAHLLASQRDTSITFVVDIFEKAPTIGFESATLLLPDGTSIATPMRAAQGGYYARLLSMYARCGIETRTIDFTYSISRNLQALMIYEGANGLRLDPVARPATQRRRDFLWLIAAVIFGYIYVSVVAMWHLLRGHYEDLNHRLHRTTLRDWCDQHRLPRIFRDTILFPLFAAVCTVPLDAVQQTPAADSLEYIAKTWGARHYLSDVRQIVVALLAPLPRSNIHLSTPISVITTGPSGSGVTLHSTDGRYFEADHVISCTPSSVATRLSRSLAKSLEACGNPPSQVCAEYARADLLSRFPAKTAIVINHRDASCLPSDKRDRRILNLDLPPLKDDGKLRDHVAATHIVAPSLFQTTNPSSTIDPLYILSEASFERALSTIDARRALRELWSPGMQGMHSLWFAGAWTSKGIPLLEGCVCSAERIARAICATESVQCSVPW